MKIQNLMGYLICCFLHILVFGSSTQTREVPDQLSCIGITQMPMSECEALLSTTSNRSQAGGHFTHLSEFQPSLYNKSSSWTDSQSEAEDTMPADTSVDENHTPDRLEQEIELLSQRIFLPLIHR